MTTETTGGYESKINRKLKYINRMFGIWCGPKLSAVVMIKKSGSCAINTVYGWFVVSSISE